MSTLLVAQRDFEPTIAINLASNYTITSHRLSPEERSLLSSISQQVGVAMENACLYERAEFGNPLSRATFGVPLQILNQARV